MALGREGCLQRADVPDQHRRVVGFGGARGRDAGHLNVVAANELGAENGEKIQLVLFGVEQDFATAHARDESTAQRDLGQCRVLCRAPRVDTCCHNCEYHANRPIMHAERECSAARQNDMRQLRTTVVAAAVGLVVAACGGSGAEDDPAAGDSASPPPQVTAPPESSDPSDPETTAPPSSSEPSAPPASPSPEPEPSSEPPDPAPTSPGDAPIEPEPGVLVGVPEPGVESGCVVMGEYLLMGGDPDVLLSGQQLRITGSVDKAQTTCQQGIPFRVESATPADS